MVLLLTITTTHQPATDLGYLLHKHPDRLHEVELSFGTARVFYPEAGERSCTAALLLDVDPVSLVRGRAESKGEGGLLGQYVNDRPYAASSFLSVAIGRAFGTALGGRCAQRPELPDQALPLVACLSALPCRGGESVLRRLFEPLGYTVTAQRHVLDETIPAWGDSAYYTVSLGATCRLAELLAHLYVLIPVLDNNKHYWVGEDEVEKLLRRGEGWLAGHPERELITSRYVKHRRSLARLALARLAEDDDPDAEEARQVPADEELALEAPIRLNDQRLDLVATTIAHTGARRVIDLGCGEGKLLARLLKERQFERIVGVDVAVRSLEIARDRLRLEDMPQRQRDRIELLHGALTYRDRRLTGYDAAAVIEVIEHLDLDRLGAFERVLFEFARPETVVLTTPNVEYNATFPNLPAGRPRHRDHRFEWSRDEFAAWSRRVAETYGYQVEFRPVGEELPSVGAPTQMGVFRRCA